MPHKRGKGTYKGYMSPPPGQHSDAYADVLRRTYGACRVNHPGEVAENKAFCARIAHSTAKRKVGF